MRHGEFCQFHKIETPTADAFFSISSKLASSRVILLELGSNLCKQRIRLNNIMEEDLILALHNDTELGSLISL